jgi:ribosomal protein S27E
LEKETRPWWQVSPLSLKNQACGFVRLGCPDTGAGPPALEPAKVPEVFKLFSLRRATMKVDCLCCGHQLELDDAYNDFEGQIKCLACSALLDILINGGKLKKVRFDSSHFKPGQKSPRAMPRVSS